MKFTILQQDILPVMQTVSRSVGVRATLPVLENILIATENGRVKIAATNLEIGIIKSLPAEVSEDGEVTVPAKTLLELIAGLKQSKLEVEASETALTITSGKFTATVNGIPATEFPAIPISQDEQIRFKKEVLQSCSSILFAAATDEGRPILTGVLTQSKGSKVDFVATDGFRLAHSQINLPEEMDFKALIPKRTFEEILRILAEERVEDVGISMAEAQNQVVFNFGQTIVSSRLIEGQYPNWERIIPAQTVARAIVNKEDILKAIRLAAIFAKNEANIIVLKTAKDHFLLESSAKELGNQYNEVEAQLEGESLQIAFNAKFLIDALSATPASQVIMEFSGALTPTIIKPMGVEGLQYVVMPVRINN